MSGAASPVGFRIGEHGLTFWIHVTPGARWEAVGGAHGDALRVRITAVPSGGAANRACAELLARAFETHRARVELDPRAKGRRKRVRIRGDAPALARRLADLAAGTAEG